MRTCPRTIPECAVLLRAASSAIRRHLRPARVAAMTESSGDMEDRVALMASGMPTWDLSDNDCAALAHVMRELAMLRAERDEACERNHALDVKCGLFEASLKKADAEVEQLGYLRESARALLVEVQRLKGEVKEARGRADFWQGDSAEAWDRCEERRIEAERATSERDDLRRRLALITAPTPEVVGRMADFLRQNDGDYYDNVARAALRALAEIVGKK